MEAYIIYSDDLDEPVAIFKKRESAFSWIKQKADASYTIKPVPVFNEIDDMGQYTYYHANCNLGDSQITVTETVYFPDIEKHAPSESCSEVIQYGARLSCSGTDLDKVALAIREFVARKRYEFEHAVRKVCGVVQPKIENNEAMTVNQIVDESGVDQDSVVKILILLKKEGFLDIVDPAEEMKKAKDQTKSKSKLWTPKDAASQIGGQTKNITTNKRGALVPIDPNKPSSYTNIMTGKQAQIPIKKKKP